MNNLDYNKKHLNNLHTAQSQFLQTGKNSLYSRLFIVKCDLTQFTAVITAINECLYLKPTLAKNT